MHALHPIVWPRMPDGSYPIRIRINPGATVHTNCVVGPATLPKFVNDLHIIICNIVAVIVGKLLFQPHRPSGAIEIAGYDIPANPPAGKMVQCGHPPREWKWRFVAEIHSDAEPEVLGRMRHGGYQQERIANWDLHRMVQGRTRRSTVNVIHAEDVCKEQPVEQASLQRSC